MAPDSSRLCSGPQGGESRSLRSLSIPIRAASSPAWAAFLKAHDLEHSMRRRGSRHDNAVAESFFNLLKREWIRRRTYRTR